MNRAKKLMDHGETDGNSGPGKREILLNDLMNTGISSALIGGFALGNFQGDEDVEEEWMSLTIYMLSFIAVHACTCSCLTSAMLYRDANQLSENEVSPWQSANKIFLHMPWMKFVAGCSCYIISVIFLSLRALENIPKFQYAALAIGLMSMSMVVVTGFGLVFNAQKSRSLSSKAMN